MATNRQTPGLPRDPYTVGGGANGSNPLMPGPDTMATLPDVDRNFARAGNPGPEAPSIKESYNSGLEQSASDYRYARAALDLALDNPEDAEQNVKLAEQHDREASALTAGKRSFMDVYNDPSFGGAMDYAKSTLAQQGPAAIEALAAYVAGNAVLPGAGGAAAGGVVEAASSTAGRAIIRSQVRKSLRGSLERAVKGAGDAADNAIFSGAMRSRIAGALAEKGGGGTAALFADEYMHGVGEFSREQNQATGEINPAISAAGAVPYAAMGALSEKLGIDTIAEALKKSGGDGVIRQGLKSIGLNTATEAASEAGQEEGLIRVHDYLTDNEYAKSDDAFNRRIEALAGGAVGGGARAGFSYGPGIAVEGLKRLRKDQTQGSGGRFDGFGDAMADRMPSGMRSRLDGMLGGLVDEPRTDSEGFVRDDRDPDESVLPEPQGDIDAQFSSMLDPDSPKRAVEVTDGSPMPRGLEGRDDIRQIETPNGTLLTNDDDVAAGVDSGAMSVRQALGYARDKSSDMNRSLVVRDSNGNVVHSEAIGNDPRDAADALERGSRFPGNDANIESVASVVSDRRNRLTAEGRDPDLEMARVQHNNALKRYDESRKRSDFLSQALSDSRLADRHDEIRQALPRAHDQMRRRAVQARSARRQLDNLEARQRSAGDLAGQEQQASERRQRMASQLRAYDEGYDGIEVTDNQTGEQMQLPRSAVEQMLPEYGEQTDGASLEYDPMDRARQRAFDELEGDGRYSVAREQAAPLSVEELDAGRANRMKVGERQLAYDDPQAYSIQRGRDNTAAARQARQSPDQLIRRQHRLGPNTQRTTIGEREVPVSAVRQLRQLQRQYPNDQWSIARVPSENGQPVFHVRRRRGLTEREADERVTRNADPGAVTERTPDAPGQVDDRAEIESGMQQGATERVLQAAAEARWNGRGEPTRSFDLELIEPDGTRAFYNRRRLASAGMDIDTPGTELNGAERRYQGQQTALGILSANGYRLPEEQAAGVPPEVRRARTARNNQKVSPAVAGMWANMDLDQRAEALGPASDIMSESEIADLPAGELPSEVIEKLEQSRWESATPQGDNSPETEYRRYDDGSTNRQPRRPDRVAPESTREGLWVDNRLGRTLSETAGASLKAADVEGDVTVVSSDVTDAELNRSGGLTAKDLDDLNAHPAWRQLRNNPPSNLRGRTIRLPSGHHVIWVNSRMSEEGRLFTMSHEIGHVVYGEHLGALLDDQTTYQRLYDEYLHDRDRGDVRRYNDETLGFEEWYADRFAAWVNNQSRSSVSEAGQFAQLRSRLRAVVQKLRKHLREAIQRGDMPTVARMRSNGVFNRYMTGVARSAALRQREQELMVRVQRGEMPTRMSDAPELQLRQVRAELAALTSMAPLTRLVRTSTRRTDALAEEQRRRLERHVEEHYLNEPDHVLESPEDYGIMPMHEYNLPEEEAPADPRGEQQFEVPEEAGQADPRSEQQFEVPEEAGQADPRGEQRYTPPSDDPKEASIRAQEIYESQPAVDDQTKAQPGKPRQRSTAAPQYSDVIHRFLHRVEENLPEVARSGLKGVRNLAWSDDSRLRYMGAHELADLFWTRPGTRHSQKGYFNGVESETAHWMERFDRVLPEDDAIAEEALREAQSGAPNTDLSPEALAIREELRNFYNEYANKHTRNLKMRNNYFPRVYDFGEITARADEFSQLLREELGIEQEAADSLVREMLSSDSAEISTVDQEGSGPGMSARLERTLARVNDTRLQEGGFVAQPRAALMGYLRSAVRSGEYHRRMSGERNARRVMEDIQDRQAQGQEVDEGFIQHVRDRIEKDGDNATVYDPSAKIREQLDKLEPADREQARQIWQNYMGRSNTLFGKQITPGIARTFSALSAVSYTATLGLSTLSQLTDFGSMVMRSRDSAGFQDLYRVLRSVPREERQAMATAVGSISAEANLEALRMSYGNDFMTPGTRRYLDTFFKAVGLDAMTRFNRSVATHMGYQFLLHHAKAAEAGEQRSQRYLEELGLSAEDVNHWSSRQRGPDQWSFDGESGERVRQALFQWTDEAILRPNAAQRPGWASNPWFTLIWQLKSFAWGMGKVVVGGMANEVHQRYRETGSLMDAAAPLVLNSAMMLPLAMTSLILRDAVKEGLNSIFDDDDYQWQTFRDRGIADWAMELTDRSGLLGAMTVANTAINSVQYGQSPFLSVMGPTAGFAGQLSQGEVSRTANDLIPVVGLVR